jgi:transcriptional regulator with GAF, ATPase, and Fis domain
MSTPRVLSSEPRSTDGVLDGLIGEAPAFEDVASRLPTLAKADGTVLITGETGTGKELVARAIHQLSPARASLPFVAINCGSLVDTLLEGELFGHERGASRTRTRGERASSRMRGRRHAIPG